MNLHDATTEEAAETNPSQQCEWFGPETNTGPGSDLWVAYQYPHWCLYRATTKPTWTLLFKGNSWMAAEDARHEQTKLDLEKACSSSVT